MKRIPVLLLILLCLIPTVLAAEQPALYTDVTANQWYTQAVQYVSERDLMQGDGNGRFLPNQPVTRGMAVTILHRLACEPDTDLQSSFSDISKNHYASQSIRWACEVGIASGGTDGRFAPNATITREQLIVFLFRFARYSKLNPAPATVPLPFSDSGIISDYARDAVSWALHVGIIQGAQTFRAGDPVTRAELAQMIMRYQLWADQRSPVALMPGEIVSLLGQKVRAVRVENQLYVLASRAETPAAKREHVRFLNGLRYLSLAYYTETLGYVEGIAPDGTRYIAEFEPLTLPEEGVDVPVLMYHAVSDDVWGMEELFISPDMMEQQLQYLIKNGYDPIWFEDLAYVERYDKPVILTFDDGYRDNYTTLLPLLKKYQVKATFFVIGQTVGWENKMNWSQLYEASQTGLVSVQSHTYTHGRLDLMDFDAQAYEMQAGQAMVAAITGKVPQILCYPGGRHNAATLALAPQYYAFGLKWDGGLYTTGNNPFLVNRFYVARSTDMETFQSFLIS